MRTSSEEAFSRDRNRRKKREKDETASIVVFVAVLVSAVCLISGVGVAIRVHGVGPVIVRGPVRRASATTSAASAASAASGTSRVLAHSSPPFPLGTS